MLLGFKMPGSKGRTLNRQARRMVYDVFQYFAKEVNVTEAYKITAAATNKSLSTIRRIIKESKTSEHIVIFRTPGKKRPRANPITGVDDFDKGVIKRCIHNFHVTEKELPTLEKLRVKLRNDINFNGSKTSLGRLIKRIGFKWKRTENNRKVLIETPTIRLLRINYLQKLKEYRRQNRPIIYTDESYVHATHAKPMGWTDESTAGLKKPISKGQRVVIVHAGSEAGFVPNALLAFKSGTKSGDYHDDMNFENYQKWIRTQLIPNLPPNSVVVVDNASYHNKEYDKAPNSNSKKLEMQAWLTKNGINFTSDMLKPQLYNLIKGNRGHLKKYSIDKILLENGHDVLRLPPYHPDLNPIEMAWASIKGYVSSKNVKWNIGRVIELINEKVDIMGAEEWNKLCDKVKSVEDQYLKSDHVVDELTEEFIIRLGESDESEVSLESDSDLSESTEDEPGPSGIIAKSGPSSGIEGIMELDVSD